MKVSITLMQYYSDEPQWKLPVAELVAKIGNQLGAVEEVRELSPMYEGIKIVEITEVKPHPNADKLSVYQISDGHKHIQVVSGDRDLKPGDKVAWIAPGQTVPSTYWTESPATLEARPLRGEMSNGMFASGKELELNDNHERVLVLDIDAPAGTLLTDIPEFGLKDAVIDIENKMFTHRPDGFGHLGVAREIAGIQGLPFTSPDWYSLDVPTTEVKTTTLPLEVKNEIPELVPRFVAVPLADVTIAPSPLWLQSYLHRLGIRPINNVVDWTNYYMVLTGQPLHAYDYDKVKALSGDNPPTLIIRHPKKGEVLELLNGKKIEPHKNAMMVAAGEQLICMGGMMGGASTEVDASTRNIILEAATWDMYSIRRTSMQHGIFTDAVTRFSKGQSPLQNTAVVIKAADDIAKDTGAHVAGDFIDNTHVPEATLRRGSVHPPVTLTSEFVNARLGTDLFSEEMAVILNNVEFRVETHGDEITVTAPFWRTDIEIPEDLVEEIGRLHGFDNLPHDLPTRPASAVEQPAIDELKSKIRMALAAAGANELQTYSFVPAKLLQDVGQESEQAFAIRNAISPELQHYRMSLTPSLLEKVHGNIKAGYAEHALFELNKIHIKGDVDCDGLPREYEALAFVYASNHPKPGAAYYQAKHFLEYLLNAIHVPYMFVAAEHVPQWNIGKQVFAPFEPKRSGYLLIDDGNGDGEFCGFIGEYRQSVRKKLKLPDYSAGFEIDVERLVKHLRATAYQPLLKFPSAEQDVCLKVSADVLYTDLEQAVKKSFPVDDALRVVIAPLDIYQRSDDHTRKQITFRITLQHAHRTLTTDEINSMLDTMVEKVSLEIPTERI